MDLRLGQALALGLAGGLIITATPGCTANSPEDSEGSKTDPADAAPPPHPADLSSELASQVKASRDGSVAQSRQD
jgi:hypothetical protein